MSAKNYILRRVLPFAMSGIMIVTTSVHSKSHEEKEHDRKITQAETSISKTRTLKQKAYAELQDNQSISSSLKSVEMEKQSLLKQKEQELQLARMDAKELLDYIQELKLEEQTLIDEMNALESNIIYNVNLVNEYGEETSKRLIESAEEKIETKKAWLEMVWSLTSLIEDSRKVRLIIRLEQDVRDLQLDLNCLLSTREHIRNEITTYRGDYELYCSEILVSTNELNDLKYQSFLIGPKKELITWDKKQEQFVVAPTLIRRKYQK